MLLSYYVRPPISTYLPLHLRINFSLTCKGCLADFLANKFLFLRFVAGCAENARSINLTSFGNWCMTTSLHGKRNKFVDLERFASSTADAAARLNLSSIPPQFSHRSWPVAVGDRYVLMLSRGAAQSNYMPEQRPETKEPGRRTEDRGRRVEDKHLMALSTIRRYNTRRYASLCIPTRRPIANADRLRR